MEPTENDALDAYSQVVSGVAEMLLPRVAAIRVRRRGRSGEASGSAVALTGEGHLITNAHVVGDADTGQATFADGSVARPRDRRPRPARRSRGGPGGPADRASRRSTATWTTSGSGASSSPWATRWACPAA